MRGERVRSTGRLGWPMTQLRVEKWKVNPAGVLDFETAGVTTEVIEDQY